MNTESVGDNIAIPVKQKIIAFAIIAVAISAIIGGGVLLGLGGSHLNPHWMAWYTHGGLWYIPVNGNGIALIQICAGSALSMIGICILISRIFKKLTASYPKLSQFNDNLTADSRWKMIKFIAIIAALTAGLILIGIASHYILSQDRLISECGHGHIGIGLYVLHNSPKFAIIRLVAGSALISTAIYTIGHEIFANRIKIIAGTVETNDKL